MGSPKAAAPMAEPTKPPPICMKPMSEEAAPAMRGKCDSAEVIVPGVTKGRPNTQMALGMAKAATLGAESVSLTVANEAGQIVYSGTGPTSAGANTVGWDGKTNSGATAGDGIYTLSVKAVDSAGATLTAPVTLKGRVSAVETVDGEVVLDVNGVKLNLTDVTAVREVATAG